MRRRAATPIAIALLALGTACSVSTPRLETTASSRGAASNETAGGGVGADPIGTADGAAAAATDGGTDAGVATGTVAGSPAAGSGASARSRGATTPAANAAAPGAAASAGATEELAAGGPADGGSVPGVTADSVAVSVIAGFSGPLGPVLEKAYQGMETWRDDVNDGGGIHGRKVVLKKVDHKETADGGVAACKEALSNGSLFAAVPEGVDATLSAIGCLDAAGMPTVYYSATTDPKWKYAFADIMTSAQGGTLMGSYVSTTLGGAGKKVGVMYVNQPAYKAMADTFVPEAKRLGSSVVAVESVEPNQASFTSQLLKMQEAGVRILVISATTETIGILRDAKSLGYAPTFTGWGFQFDFVTVGARNLFDGVTGLRTYATVDAPAYERYAARMEARGRGRDRTQDLEGFPSYGHALVIGELLERAGPNPTRASVVAGAETVRDYDNGILPSITWGPGNHEGATGAFPTICCNADYTWKSQGPATARFS